jgi:chromosome partitioning protein
MPEDHSPVVSFASTKGGVGKTTLAYVLAASFARRWSDGPDIRNYGNLPRRKEGSPEFRVACVDADPNKVLDAALRKSGLPDILSLQSDGETLLRTLRDAQQRAWLVLIDLEGSANQAMLYAAGKSDLVLIPAQPSAFDVAEAIKTVGVIRQAADLVGREIKHRVVLTRTPVLRQRVADHSRAQFARAGLPVLPVELVHRVAFQTMSYTGQPPFVSDPGGGAASNVESLTDAVSDLLGLPVWQPQEVVS